MSVSRIIEFPTKKYIEHSIGFTKNIWFVLRSYMVADFDQYSRLKLYRKISHCAQDIIIGYIKHTYQYLIPSIKIILDFYEEGGRVQIKLISSSIIDSTSLDKDDILVLKSFEDEFLKIRHAGSNTYVEHHFSTLECELKHIIDRIQYQIEYQIRELFPDKQDKFIKSAFRLFNENVLKIQLDYLLKKMAEDGINEKDWTIDEEIHNAARHLSGDDEDDESWRD